MVMSNPLSQLQSANLPNTCQYVIHNEDRGVFLVQIAWPLAWSEKGVPPEDDETCQTLFVVDGNAYWYTAVDITRRMEYLYKNRTVVVGVGYPNPKTIYDYRRGPDLTPASPDGKYEGPPGKDGKPRTDISFGKALEFLEIIQTDVVKHIYERLLPIPALFSGRKAFYGHSYGGIFALYVLYTVPELFGTVIAGSPIIWWNKNCLIDVYEAKFRANKEKLQHKPSLFCTWGLNQHEVVRRPGEADDLFERRKGIAEDPQMKDSVLKMATRLRACGKLRTVQSHEFVDEDHGSSAVTGLQMGIMKWLRHEI